MKKVITLTNSKKGWLARFTNDEEVLTAFGTDTLPTAFTEMASPMEVKRVIERLNPGYDVIFA